MSSVLERIREQRPLVHCITNMVTVNECANMLLAAGARPTMAHHEREVEEITRGCDSLVLNLGATEYYEAMLIAAEAAGGAGHPIVLDPVGCGGSSFRREMFWEIAKRAPLCCIRGNASEIRALEEGHTTVTGVDAMETGDSKTARQENQELAGALARRTKSIVVLSGEVDIVTDGTQYFLVENGDVMMTQITGSGCMATALLGAGMAATKGAGMVVSKGTEMEATNGAEIAVAAGAEAAAWVMSALGICGENAAQKCRAKKRGTMSFHQFFLDQMSLLTEAEIQCRSKIRSNSSAAGPNGHEPKG